MELNSIKALELWCIDRIRQDINRAAWDGIPNFRPTPLLPSRISHNFWIYLFIRFGLDTRWQRNAWMKICEKTQADLDRDNHVWLWEKSVLLNK